MTRFIYSQEKGHGKNRNKNYVAAKFQNLESMTLRKEKVENADSASRKIPTDMATYISTASLCLPRKKFRVIMIYYGRSGNPNQKTFFLGLN